MRPGWGSTFAMSAVVMKMPVPTTEPMVSSAPSQVVRPRTRVGLEGGEADSSDRLRGVAMRRILAVFGAQRQHRKLTSHENRNKIIRPPAKHSSRILSRSVESRALSNRKYLTSSRGRPAPSNGSARRSRGNSLKPETYDVAVLGSGLGGAWNDPARRLDPSVLGGPAPPVPETAAVPA